ncbi:hypothetical protein MMC21_005801 [Puttea exsequens]|nr:hypothetical protein [Puttea exsequens]
MGCRFSKPRQEPASYRKSVDDDSEEFITPQALYLPSVQALARLIETDSTVYLLFDQMFQQIPMGPPYDKDPSGKPQVRDYLGMLGAFNKIIQSAPTFTTSSTKGFHPGTPIGSILTWPMGTEAGTKAFANSNANAAIRDILQDWARFLSSQQSTYVLNTSEEGWFGPAAMQAMPDFVETFVCDPSVPAYGFRSWDDFFTRRIRPGVRPVDFPADDSIINNPCEGTVYGVATKVKHSDSFWLKQQPYSLKNMLSDDEMVDSFVGGSVYQAFLGPLVYHRWHSPVKGTIHKTALIPGTYYAQCPAVGFDATSPVQSLPFTTHVATRAAIYIKADNPKIGIMCFLGVGLCEMSSCEITVSEGESVQKGDELGRFHFGGSTHCLIFRPSTQLLFSDPVSDPTGQPVNVNAAIAVVK